MIMGCFYDHDMLGIGGNVFDRNGIMQVELWS